MIKYKCKHCGTNLETDNQLSGKQEACPACKSANQVPFSKKYQKQLKEKEQQQHLQQLAQQHEKVVQHAEQQNSLQQLSQQHKKTVHQAEQGRGRAIKNTPENRKYENAENYGPSCTEDALWTIGIAFLILAMIVLITQPSHRRQKFDC